MNTVQTINTFQNRNVIHYNEYSTDYFQPKIARKIRILSLRGKKREWKKEKRVW